MRTSNERNDDRRAGSDGRAADGHPVRAGERTLLACFPDFVTARAAIEDLETSGLESATMAFDESSLARAEQSPESGARDERFLRRAGGKLLRGALVGALAGLLAGIVVGLVLFTDGPAAGVFAAGLGATAAGALVGAAMGGIWNHQQSPAWEETFEAPETGVARLYIRVTSDEQKQLVESVLADHDGELSAGGA